MRCSRYNTENLSNNIKIIPQEKKKMCTGEEGSACSSAGQWPSAPLLYYFVSQHLIGRDHHFLIMFFHVRTQKIYYKISKCNTGERNKVCTTFCYVGQVAMGYYVKFL